MVEEGLRDMQRTSEVLLDSVNELLTVYVPDRILGANHGRTADQNVNLSATSEFCKCSVDFFLVCDISRGHEYLDMGELLFDRCFGGEEGHFSAAKKSDSRSTCDCEGHGCLCTNTRAASSH
jgi:hypothetical protein